MTFSQKKKEKRDNVKLTTFFDILSHQEHRVLFMWLFEKNKKNNPFLFIWWKTICMFWYSFSSSLTLAIKSNDICLTLTLVQYTIRSQVYENYLVCYSSPLWVRGTMPLAQVKLNIIIISHDCGRSETGAANVGPMCLVAFTVKYQYPREKKDSV